MSMFRSRFHRVTTIRVCLLLAYQDVNKKRLSVHRICNEVKLGLITPTHLPSINFGTLLALNLKRLLVEIEICHCFQLVKDV